MRRLLARLTEAWGRVLTRLAPVRTALRPVADRLSVVTPLGWTVLVASVAALIAGAIVGWLELLLAGVTGLLTLALCTLFILGKVDIEITLDPSERRFKEGRSTTVAITVLNKGRSRLPAMTLEVMVGGEATPFQLKSLAAGQSRSESFPVYGARRGVLQLGPATMVRSDPLGLLEMRTGKYEITYLYIHPETIPLSPLGTGLLRDLEGRPTNDLSMADLAFHTLRDYAPGDDRRYIHWRSSAKRLAAGFPPLVKQFQDTRRTQLLVVVDGTRSSYEDADDFELAIRAGASIAVQAVRDDIEMTFICADQMVRRTPTHRLSRQVVLDACAKAEFTRTSLETLVSNAVAKARETTYAFVVTGSRPDNRRLQHVASKVPGEARTNVLRVEPDGQRHVIPGATVSLLTLTELKDLRVLLHKGDKV